MLHLAETTDPGWYDRIAPDLETILVDHAHLERRAGSTAMSMIFRYSDRPELMLALSEIVQEEMDHFRRMLELFGRRQITFCSLKPAPYAGELMKHARKHDPEALLDKLLVASLIEARSCERFQILAEQVDDEELRAFYQELYVCEARHHTTYTDLARRYFPLEQVRVRLDELARAEVEALRASEGVQRLHAW